MKQLIKGRPAAVNEVSLPAPKTPLSRLLRDQKQKQMGMLGSPCVVNPLPKQGTKAWRENLTSNAWPSMIHELGFKKEDLPQLYEDQLKQLANIAPASVTIEPPGDSDKVTPLYTDSWKEVELARELHMRACMHFLRNEIHECLNDCNHSSAHYLKAIEGLHSIPKYDDSFERFITIQNSKVLRLQTEAKKQAEKIPEERLSPNDAKQSD